MPKHGPLLADLDLVVGADVGLRVGCRLWLGGGGLTSLSILTTIRDARSAGGVRAQSAQEVRPTALERHFGLLVLAARHKTPPLGEPWKRPLSSQAPGENLGHKFHWPVAPWDPQQHLWLGLTEPVLDKAYDQLWPETLLSVSSSLPNLLLLTLEKSRWRK